MVRNAVPGTVLPGTLLLALLIPACQPGETSPARQHHGAALQAAGPQGQSESADSPATGSIDSPPPSAAPLSPEWSDQEMQRRIRQAAGPLADQVNSSLARLNTNLGKKEHTLVIMALKSETRRWYFLTHFMDIIDTAQIHQANEIIASYDGAYQDLLDRRADILENASDDNGTDQLLDINRVAVIKLSIQLRRQLIREVLDAEQRKQFAAKFAPDPEPRPAAAGESPANGSGKPDNR